MQEEQQPHNPHPKVAIQLHQASCDEPENLPNVSPSDLSPTPMPNLSAKGSRTGSRLSSTSTVGTNASTSKILETTDDIRQRREQVLERYEAFKHATKQRRTQLEDAHRFQTFKRNAKELELWIAEKMETALDGCYKDPTNLQAKIQKHMAFEAEVVAHKHVLDNICTDGRQMIAYEHYASDEIKHQIDELVRLWEALLQKLSFRGRKLKQAFELVHFLRDVDDVIRWINDKIAFVSTDEVGHDLEHVEVLEKKFDDFMQDIKNHDGRISTVIDLGDRLVAYQDQPEHARAAVEPKQKVLSETWRRLKQLCKARQEKLEEAHEIQKFFRDNDETIAWINEKDAQLKSATGDFGRDLATIQNLIRKHGGLERDLQAINEKVTNLSDDADRLLKRKLEKPVMEQIRLKRDDLQGHWTRLRDKAGERRTELERSLELHQFLANERELLLWMKELRGLIEADELGFDIGSAERLLDVHRKHSKDFAMYEDSFGALRTNGQRLIDSGHYAADDIKERMANVQQQKEMLLTLIKDRQSLYEQCMSLQLFLRDAEQCEAAMTKFEAFLENDSLGDSLESVEALIRKQDDFERSLDAFEEKMNALNTLTGDLLAAEHYASDDIADRRAILTERCARIVERTHFRSAILEESLKFQMFDRDANEFRTYVADKMKVATDESYRDTSNLTGKVQKHQTFSKEIHGHSSRLHALQRAANALIESNHYHCDVIKERVKELEESWMKLLLETDRKEKLLLQASEQMQFHRNVEDFEIWMADVEAQLHSDELGRDLSSVQYLLKRLSLLEADIRAHQDRVDGFRIQAERFKSLKYFEAETAAIKAQLVASRFSALREPLQTRREKLVEALRLFHFLRDIDDEEDWIQDKESVVNSTNRGKDLMGVRNLMQKHRAVQAEIDAHQRRIQEVLETAKNMVDSDHLGAREIAHRSDLLEERWNHLREAAETRYKLLQDSMDVQQYLLDAAEAEWWIMAKQPIIDSTNFGKDEDGALALLNRHTKLMADVEAFGKTIADLARQAQKCNVQEWPEGDENKEFVVALYDYQQQTAREISIHKGDLMSLLNSRNRVWWKVELRDQQGFVPATFLKKIDAPKSKLSEEQAVISIPDRQVQLEESYQKLLTLGRKRLAKIDQSVKAYQLVREANELAQWVLDKETIAITEELSPTSSIEEVEAKQKKISDIQKDMHSQEEKLARLTEIAQQLNDLGQTDAAEKIVSQIETLTQRWVALRQVTAEKSNYLVRSHEVQRYTRDCEETKEWMLEKQHLLQSQDYGKNLAEVQRLQRKHEAVEHDLAALGEKVKELDDTANRLMLEHTNQAEAIYARQTELNELWNEITALADARKAKLLDSYDLQRFFSDFSSAPAPYMAMTDEYRTVLITPDDASEAIKGSKCSETLVAPAIGTVPITTDGTTKSAGFLFETGDLMSWIKMMTELVSSIESGNDVTAVESQIERHQNYRAEMDARALSFKTFESFGHQLLQNKHFASDEIQSRLKSMEEARKELEKAWEVRRNMLDQALEYQLFMRDCKNLEEWMENRESALSAPEQVDVDTSVEVLIKRHENIKRALGMHEEKIESLKKYGQQLVESKHFAANEIENKVENVLSKWTYLKDKMVEERSKIGEAESLQSFIQEADTFEIWLNEKMQAALDETHKDPTNVRSKYQKQQAVESEIAMNAERITQLVDLGQKLVELGKCSGQSEAVRKRLERIVEEWEVLTEKTREKSEQLRQANLQSTYNAGMKQLDLWLGEVETALQIDDLAKDLTMVQNMMQQFTLVETEVSAREKLLCEMHQRGDELVESGRWDAVGILEHKKMINQRYEVVRERCENRHARLHKLLAVFEFYRDVDDEISWVKEKRLLVTTRDYGRDLISAENLRKKHRLLQQEISLHDETHDKMLETGRNMIKDTPQFATDIEDRLRRLAESSEEVVKIASQRANNLEQSVAYQQVHVSFDEIIGWVVEKEHLLANPDYGNSLMAVQTLLNKHVALETECVYQLQKCTELCAKAVALIDADNMNKEALSQECRASREKLEQLRGKSKSRYEKLMLNKMFYEFLWKVDAIEAWIVDREALAKAQDFGRDLSSVQALIEKQETFDQAVETFEKDNISSVCSAKNELLASGHSESAAATKRLQEVIDRFSKLKNCSQTRMTNLRTLLAHYQRLDELFLEFAKKASEFNSWFENAEEDLTDPVRCNSVEEVLALKQAQDRFKSDLANAEGDFQKLREIDREIRKNTDMANPYTWFTMETLEETWKLLQNMIAERDADIEAELGRQDQNENLRKKFAKLANGFHSWLVGCKREMMDYAGSLEEQVQSIKKKRVEIEMHKSDVQEIEEVASFLNECLILDNRYTEHSAVSLTQQWDQLQQLGMRLQHNLEQQIEARNRCGVSEESLREFAMLFKHFDRERTGKIDHHSLKMCLSALGHDLPYEGGDTFEAVLDVVDPSRSGFITLHDFMAFMISKESDNVGGASEFQDSLVALADGKPYITKSELYVNLPKDHAEYCIRMMPLYVDRDGHPMVDCYDYTAFTKTLFQ